MIRGSGIVVYTNRGRINFHRPWLSRLGLPIDRGAIQVSVSASRNRLLITQELRANAEVHMMRSRAYDTRVTPSAELCCTHATRRAFTQAEAKSGHELIVDFDAGPPWTLALSCRPIDSPDWTPDPAEARDDSSIQVSSAPPPEPEAECVSCKPLTFEIGGTTRTLYVAEGDNGLVDCGLTRDDAMMRVRAAGVGAEMMKAFEQYHNLTAQLGDALKSLQRNLINSGGQS